MEIYATHCLASGRAAAEAPRDSSPRRASIIAFPSRRTNGRVERQASELVPGRAARRHCRSALAPRLYVYRRRFTSLYYHVAS